MNRGGNCNQGFGRSNMNCNSIANCTTIPDKDGSPVQIQCHCCFTTDPALDDPLANLINMYKCPPPQPPARPCCCSSCCSSSRPNNRSQNCRSQSRVNGCVCGGCCSATNSRKAQIRLNGERRRYPIFYESKPQRPCCCKPNTFTSAQPQPCIPNCSPAAEFCQGQQIYVNPQCMPPPCIFLSPCYYGPMSEIDGQVKNLNSKDLLANNKDPEEAAKPDNDIANQMQKNDDNTFEKCYNWNSSQPQPQDWTSTLNYTQDSKPATIHLRISIEQGNQVQGVGGTETERKQEPKSCNCGHEMVKVEKKVSTPMTTPSQYQYVEPEPQPAIQKEEKAMTGFGRRISPSPKLDEDSDSEEDEYGIKGGVSDIKIKIIKSNTSIHQSNPSIEKTDSKPDSFLSPTNSKPMLLEEDKIGAEMIPPTIEITKSEERRKSADIVNYLQRKSSMKSPSVKSDSKSSNSKSKSPKQSTSKLNKSNDHIENPLPKTSNSKKSHTKSSSAGKDPFFKNPHAVKVITRTSVELTDDDAGAEPCIINTFQNSEFQEYPAQTDGGKYNMDTFDSTVEDFEGELTNQFPNCKTDSQTQNLKSNSNSGTKLVAKKSSSSPFLVSDY